MLVVVCLSATLGAFVPMAFTAAVLGVAACALMFDLHLRFKQRLEMRRLEQRVVALESRRSGIENARANGDCS